MRMVMNEDTLDALFRMWEASGLGTQRPGIKGRGKSTGPRFFFKDVTAPDFSDDWSNTNVEPVQYEANLPSLLSFGAAISRQYKGSGKTKMIRATKQPALSRATAVTSGDIPAPAHVAIKGRNAPLLVISDRRCGVLMNRAWPTIGLTSWLRTNEASDAARGFVRLWHREIQGALHHLACLGTATATGLPWLFHRADRSFTSLCQCVHRFNKQVVFHGAPFFVPRPVCLLWCLLCIKHLRGRQVPRRMVLRCLESAECPRSFQSTGAAVRAGRCSKAGHDRAKALCQGAQPEAGPFTQEMNPSSRCSGPVITAVNRNIWVRLHCAQSTSCEERHEVLHAVPDCEAQGCRSAE